MSKFNWKPFGRISVCIDNANLIHSPSKMGWKVGLQNLALFIKESGSVVDIKLFDSIPLVADLNQLRTLYPDMFSQVEHDKYVAQSLVQQKIFGRAQTEWGITVFTKPLRLIVDNIQKRIIPKGDCDIDMVVEMIRKRKTYDTLILVAGDGDFVPLVRYLRECNKQIIVMSDRGLIAHILVEASNFYIPFTRYRKELEVKKAH